MNDLIQVSVRPCPLDPGRNSFEFASPAGTTVGQIVARALPLLAPEDHKHVYAFQGDRVIDCTEWHVVPEPGPGLIVRLRPTGGAALRSVLQIGLSIVALGASAIGGPLAGAAVMLIGSFLLNALVPVQKPKKDKPQYSIQGWKNPLNPDGVVPDIRGKIRLAPPYAAGPYTEIVDDDRYVRAIFCIGYGSFVLSDLRFGDTPLEHWRDIDYEIIPPGTLTLYPQQVIEEPIARNLQYDQDDAEAGQTEGLPVKNVSARDTTHVILNFTFPEGLYHTKTNGDPASSGVIIRIRARKIDTSIWNDIETLTISKKKTKTFTRKWEWTPPERTQWEFECTRMNPEQNSTRKHTQVDWTLIQSFRPESPLNWSKGATYIAMRARASKQLHGAPDAFNLLASRLALDWDTGTGAWVSRETSNPAAAFRLELQGEHVPYPLRDDQVDLVGLADFAEHCTAKGLTYDAVHDSEASWQDRQNEIAHAGRATRQDRGDKVSVVIDRPRDVVMAHITPRNSYDFSWQTSYVKPPDALKVKFLDKTNDYVEAERVVPWVGFVGEPVTIESIEQPGNVNPDTIWSETRRRMYEAIHRPVSYEVTQDFEHLANTRGDLVYLNHDVLDRHQISARIVSVQAGSVTLDEYVEMEIGQTYLAVIRNIAPGATDSDEQPARSITRTVRTVPGRTRLLFFVGPGDAPAEGDLLLFGTSTQVKAECLIQKIEGMDNLSGRLTLIPHAPEIDALVEADTPPAWDGRVGEVLSAGSTAPAVPVITNIETGSETENNDVLVFLQSGAGTVPVASFDVQHRLSGALTWTTVSVSAGAGAAEILSYSAGDIIEVRARAVGIAGLQSAYSAISTATFGSNDPTITTFSVMRQPVNNLWRIEWALSDPLAQAAGLHIKYRLGLWDLYSDLTDSYTGTGSGIISVSPWDSSVPEADGTYTFGAVPVRADGTEIGSPLLTIVSTGLEPALIFSDQLNSQYLPVI